MGGCSSTAFAAGGADAMPMRRAVEACVGADGDRAQLRAYILSRAPTALDGLRRLRGPDLASSVAALADGFKRWQPEPRAAPAPRAAGAAHVRIDETALRGISLPQLRAYVADAAKRCKKEAWKSRSGEPLTPEALTLYDLATHAIGPLAAATGLSVVETLADGPQPPAWFVSHWWGEDLLSFIKCLEQHCKDRKLDEATTYYWVCAYALRQSALDDELDGGVGVSPFMRAIQLCDGTISVLDGKAIAISRAWCALELYETTLGRGAAYLHDIYTAHEFDNRQGEHFSAVGLVDGLGAADNGSMYNKSYRERYFPLGTLGGAKAFALRGAEASREEDLAAIRRQVGVNEQRLDRTVRARFGLQQLPALMRTDAQGTAEQLRALLDDLRGSQLRKLRVTFEVQVELSAAAMAQLGASLPASLEELVLYHGGGGPAIAQPLCKLIKDGRLPRLRTLHLNHLKLGDEAGIALAKVIKGNPTLTDVNLK
ncbi:hypothetical protein KFE25_004378 [Diacronema lutheri]|uniref:Uncharacterized protein n=1 Tax=Diacronema lutheri TaxID=2081491 RepID=A0A8J6C374_DIALT|nr:hypothetical protein KFE25_004378 [Diacronema lutheri]